MEARRVDEYSRNMETARKLRGVAGGRKNNLNSQERELLRGAAQIIAKLTAEKYPDDGPGEEAKK